MLSESHRSASFTFRGGGDKGEIEIPKTKSNSGCIINFSPGIGCTFCEAVRKKTINLAGSERDMGRRIQ